MVYTALGETNADGKLLYPQLQETREQIGVPSRFDQVREATRNDIADEYNGDRKILTAIRAYAFVVYEILAAQGKRTGDYGDLVWDQGTVVF